MPGDPAELRSALKRYFGFTSFRPLQEEIIRDSLGGKDVFAVLPTGGGKSLCFQLPALVRPGLTVVVSPLIALMKDQVDALKAAGVPATFLNSSLAAGQSGPRLRGLHNGGFRLLYVAPERRMLSVFLDDLARCRQGRGLRTNPVVCARPSARERHYLLPGAQDGRGAGRQTQRRRCSRRALSRGHGNRRADAEPGSISARRGARRLRHDCL